MIRGWRTFLFGLGAPPTNGEVGERGVALMGMRGHIWKGRTCHATCSMHTPVLIINNPRDVRATVLLEKTRSNRHLLRQHLESGQCHCGIYLRSVLVPDWTRVVFSCLAEVTAWGRIAHYSDGVRAEAVRIESIWDCPVSETRMPALWNKRESADAISYEIVVVRPTDVHAALTRRYGVPVHDVLPPEFDTAELSDRVLYLKELRAARVKRLLGRGSLEG